MMTFFLNTNKSNNLCYNKLLFQAPPDEMFPSDWGVKSSVQSKRRKTEDENSNYKHAINTDDEIQNTEENEICRRILLNLNKGKRTADLPEHLNLDTLLNCLSYRSLLCNMLGKCEANGNGQQIASLPIITKAYEESFMREVMMHEKKCASNALCEGLFIDCTQPVVLPEFLLPGENTGDTPKLCVLCSRKTTQHLFYDMMYAKKPFPHALIQRYGNIYGPGEYAQECLLMCPGNAPLACMPLPIMSHQRNRYVVRNSGGYQQIMQVHVAYEDFHRPSTNDQS